MTTSHSSAETFISYVQWLLTSTLFLLGLQATRTLSSTVIVFIRTASVMTSTTGNAAAARHKVELLSYIMDVSPYNNNYLYSTALIAVHNIFANIEKKACDLRDTFSQ